MARTMNLDPDAAIYRAKILKKYRGQDPFISYEGPYTTRSAAQARITFWANYLAERDYETGEVSTAVWAKGWVEIGTVTWKRVDTDPQHLQE